MTYKTEYGPTLLDQMAMAAMQGILASGEYLSDEELTGQAYEIAQAMFKERQRITKLMQEQT